MGSATFFKLTTVLFAATTAFLLLRGPESLPAPPAAPGSPATALPPVPASSPRAEQPPPESDPPAPESSPVDPVAMEEDPVSLARRALVDRDGPPSKRLLAALEARKDEILPVLEDWIRRADELGKAGIGVERILDAYARLAGVDAIPLLSDCLVGRSPSRPAAARALLALDDPRAVEVLRAYQRALSPGAAAAGPSQLWRRGGRWRDLVREWAVDPPPGHPRVRTWAREAIFLYGSEEEREAIWRTRDGEPPEESEFLWTKIDPRWPEPWPMRARAEALTRLGSEDPWTRLRGMRRVVLNPEIFEPEVLARVEATLKADLEAEAPAGVDDVDHYRRSIRASLEQIGKRRAREAKVRKLDELLRPR